MVLNSVASAGRSAVAQAILSAIHPFAELRQDSPFAIIAFGNGHVHVHVHVHVCVWGGGGKKKRKGIVAGQKQPLGAVCCKTKLFNSGGQFDQLCNLIGGAILARALC